MPDTAQSDIPVVSFENPPENVKKEKFLLGNLPMPDDPSLEEGAKNRLKVTVQYLKDGMGRGQGRGIYLTFSGHAAKPIAGTTASIESFRLMQDPSVYILIEPAKRFNAKKLAAAAAGAAEAHQGLLLKHVAAATLYYEELARKAAPGYPSLVSPLEDSRL